MKKLVLGTLALGACVVWIAKKPATAVKPAEATPVVAARVAKVASAKMADAPDLSRLSREQVEAKIAAIDAEIEAKKLVERSNRGELDESEQVALRRLLHERNDYFSRKLDFDLGEG